MRWFIIAVLTCAAAAWCVGRQARAQTTSGPAAATPTASASATTGDSADSSGDSGSDPSPQQPVAPAPIHKALTQQIACNGSDPVFVQFTPRDIQGLKAARARYAAEKAAGLNGAGHQTATAGKPAAIPQNGTARAEKSAPDAAAILKSILEK